MRIERCWLLPAWLMVAVCPAQDPLDAAAATFDQGLTEVHILMEKARWADARAALLALIAANERQPLVQAQKDAIVFDLQTCCFFAQAKVPQPEDLLAGKIASYNEKTGKIKVEYRDNLTDWEGESTLLVHPLVFAGPYSITATGRMYPGSNESLRLFFDLDDEGYYIADFGFAQQDHGNHTVELPASIARGTDGEPAVLEKGRSNAKPGKPFTALVRVSDDRVEMVLDKKTVLKIKRPEAELGQVGVVKGQVTNVVLEGKIEPAWFQSRVDEEIARQRATFEQSWKAEQELPAWLFEHPRTERTKPRHASWLPGVEDLVSPALAKVLELMGERKTDEAEKALAAIAAEDLEPETRGYLEASFKLQAGRPEQALERVAPLLATTPDSTPLLLLRARALEDAGQLVESLDQLRQAVAGDPGEPSVYEALCVAFLRHGRLDDARRLLRDAKIRHGLWQEVASLDQLLAMAQRGPAWPRRYSHTSTHYEVVSDIDRRVCMQACSLLEQSYVNLMAQMSWLKEDKSQPRFRVFLFSGEAGYQEYNKAIIGSTMPHTAGLYSPVLKQLLIWNLPKREDMERTIRHEGFHQFLDRVMDNPPVWLNEGTAEFWETARREGGRIEGGQVRRDHIATLVRSRAMLPTLEQFVFGSRDDFYANAQLRYAQAWALVHYLRKGPRDVTGRFATLWDALRGEGSARAALEKAFAGVDWQDFEKGFWEYVLQLK